MIHKIRVNEDNTATVVCPECKHSKKANFRSFRGEHAILAVKCNCTNRFLIRLEFRQQYRKPTTLDGYFEKPGNYGIMTSVTPRPPQTFNCIIKNISRSGIGFTKLGSQKVTPGNTLSLQFALDNNKKTEITKKAVVKSVHNDFIGCEFTDLPGEVDTEMGLYLVTRQESGRKKTIRR